MHMQQESTAGLADLLEQLQEIRRDLPTRRDPVESRTWQILLVALPIFLTSVLAGLGYIAQTKLQEGVQASTKRVSLEIARSDELFKSRVALGEELYKRRLTAYEKAHVRLLALQRGIHEYLITKDERAMNRSLAALNSYYSENAIYLSNDLHTRLVNLWYTAGQIGRPGGHPDSAVQPQIESIQDIIAKDLNVGELLRVQGIEVQ